MAEKKLTEDQKEMELLREAVMNLLEWDKMHSEALMYLLDRDKEEQWIEVDVELNTRRLEILLWLTLLFNIGTGVLVVLFHLWIL